MICVSPRFPGIETKMKIIIKKLEHSYKAFPANISKPVMLMKATLCQQCVAATNSTAGALLSWCGLWEPPQLGTVQPQSNTQQQLTHAGDISVPGNVGLENWAEKMELVEQALAAGEQGLTFYCCSYFGLATSGTSHIHKHSWSLHICAIQTTQ